MTIAKVDTASSITTPGTAAASTKIPLIATVRSRDGAYVPTGTVTFQLSNGTVIGTDGLDGSGRASVDYTTPIDDRHGERVLATYVGDGNANGSKTATDSIKVTAQSSTIVPVPPSTLREHLDPAGREAQPIVGAGTVEFAVNGKYVRNRRP